MQFAIVESVLLLGFIGAVAAFELWIVRVLFDLAVRSIAVGRARSYPVRVLYSGVSVIFLFMSMNVLFNALFTLATAATIVLSSFPLIALAFFTLDVVCSRPELQDGTAAQPVAIAAVDTA